VAVILDLIIDQGTTVDETVFPPLHLENDDHTPFDLTNYGVRGKVRSSYSSPTALASFAFDVSAAAGIIQPLLTAAQTAVFPRNRDVVYDVEIYLMEGDVEKVKRVVQGVMSVDPESTRGA